MSHRARSQVVQECIQECKDCHEICVDTVAYCLEVGGHHAAAPHVVLLLDCAEICTVSEDFMLRGSAFDAQLCAVCADVCDACAVACAQFTGDQQMQACASACQSCADACRRMVAATTSQSSHASQSSHGSQASRKP